MPKPKAQTSTFAFIRGLFGSSTPKSVELKVEQRKADEEVLDRGASVSLFLAEHFAHDAVKTNDPAKATLSIGAVREARECAKARKEVTGGGMAGGTQTGQAVTVRIEHSGQYVSDDFHDFKAPLSNEPHIPVQAGSSKTE